MSHVEQLVLMRKFILQEVKACEEANPTLMTIIEAKPLVDWLHPAPTTVMGVYSSCADDGVKQTVLICEPVPEWEPTIMRWWDIDKEIISDFTAVYVCPNAVIVMRPTEPGDFVWKS